jgi:hypothetical protein
LPKCQARWSSTHCSHCETDVIAYNSCRNRHCPKCQAFSAKRCLEARQSQLLPVDYYHVVFTLPAAISQLAFYNKADMYGLLMKAAAQILNTIANDAKHLGAYIGTTMVLHTWGSAMVHHPHVHCIVPGGGIKNGERQWQACKKRFFLHVRVLSRLFFAACLSKDCVRYLSINACCSLVKSANLRMLICSLSGPPSSKTENGWSMLKSPLQGQRQC